MLIAGNSASVAQKAQPAATTPIRSEISSLIVRAITAFQPRQGISPGRSAHRPFDTAAGSARAARSASGRSAHSAGLALVDKPVREPMPDFGLRVGAAGRGAAVLLDISASVAPTAPAAATNERASASTDFKWGKKIRSPSSSL